MARCAPKPTLTFRAGEAKEIAVTIAEYLSEVGLKARAPYLACDVGGAPMYAIDVESEAEYGTLAFVQGVINFSQQSCEVIVRTWSPPSEETPQSRAFKRQVEKLIREAAP